jgi:hypothetical protein
MQAVLLAIPLVLLTGASRGHAARPVARAGSASASATGAGAGRTSRGRAVPRIAFDSEGLDFRIRYQGEVIVHAFRFRNRGLGRLRIEDVQSDCGCTTGLPDKRELKPHESSSVRIAFDTTGYRGKVSKTIVVRSNDPARPVVRLHIGGTVKAEVELPAAGIYFGKLAPGSTVERSVSIRPLDVTNFSIADARSDDPAVRVTSVQSAGGAYQVTVQVGPIGAPRTVNAKVVLSTDLPHQKKLIFRAYGRVTAGGAGVGPAH